MQPQMPWSSILHQRRQRAYHNHSAPSQLHGMHSTSTEGQIYHKFPLTPLLKCSSFRISALLSSTFSPTIFKTPRSITSVAVEGPRQTPNFPSMMSWCGSRFACRLARWTMGRLLIPDASMQCHHLTCGPLGSMIPRSLSMTVPIPQYLLVLDWTVGFSDKTCP